MLRLSGEAILHRIGEAVARPANDFTTAHPEVRWRAMKGMRDLVAHDYGAVDHGIPWNAMAHNLPQEAAHVRRILDGAGLPIAMTAPPVLTGRSFPCRSPFPLSFHDKGPSAGGPMDLPFADRPG
ncbi:HepT-like ribonuclease domain-containing protein, partial [Streptomyces alkaliphilus]